MHIAIADDDLSILNSVTDFFAQQPYVRQLSTFRSLDELQTFVQERPNAIDYLFLDIHFGHETSIEIIPSLLKGSGNLEIIMFTTDDSNPQLMKCFFAGATGFLPKSIPTKELGHYLKVCLNGGAAMTPKIARELIQFFRPGRSDSDNNLAAQQLTEKEARVLQLLASGYTYQEIARNLDVSINNVKYYLKRLYRKLNVGNRSEAVSAYWAAKNDH